MAKKVSRKGDYALLFAGVATLAIIVVGTNMDVARTTLLSFAAGRSESLQMGMFTPSTVTPPSGMSSAPTITLPVSLTKPPAYLSIPTLSPIPTLPLVPGQSAPTACGVAGFGLKKSIRANGTCCVSDGGAMTAAECCSGTMVMCDSNAGGKSIGTDADCKIYLGVTKGAKVWCDAKPVVYLYPKVPTFVDVSLVVPGKILISNPQYPDGGWSHVLANPDGKLTYNGNIYSELFYEAGITPIDPPTTGWVVARSDLVRKLSEITTRLGLITSEQDEFIRYWQPRLLALNKPYIFISVFSSEQKEKIDQVDISPKPDTFIQFIMYYRGVDTLMHVSPLYLPVVQSRKGFTAVEWGGIID